ncbi:MAG TPA: imidazole glycerol phosphate synthase subunit HisH [Stellaceae bacterium]|nr:imidazole glycerol phosphate synthase subunit HisH [Stellaceae bacterium]
MTTVVIDYGSGNLRSAAKALERAARESGADGRVLVTNHADSLRGASRIVLPGVGAFADCRRGLAAVPGMEDALRHMVIEEKRPFLGICVGMQLLAERGREFETVDGLGWIGGEVVPLAPADPSLKIPHMGWNDLKFRQRHAVFDGIADGAHAYFVHSYGFAPHDSGDVVGEVDYGGPVVAAIARENIVGVQFHPEKSQMTGLKLIANFLRWRP